jgi:hypothetical protein
MRMTSKYIFVRSGQTGPAVIAYFSWLQIK